MAQIIFLHGASSSGKSTIAKVLQTRIEKPFWHVSIDHLRDSGVLPLSRFRSGEFVWSDARKAFFDGFHASLAAYADAGNNLILEHILDTDGWLETLRGLLARHDVFFVAVHCPLDVLIAREIARGDRPVGSARRDHETIHIGKSYDLELNSVDGVEVNVDKLLAAWRNARRSSSFGQDGIESGMRSG
ncbi:MAG: chloramphenicol phosphotransferase CPT family protein [Pseudochelatococcus sp.]|uniref:chloramphenicol phosphotransferase CPT family protein n=1 Tax=Pseudochelatococcus sp. TaxID=2020869 RepID=UPI003D8F4526